MSFFVILAFICLTKSNASQRINIAKLSAYVLQSLHLSNFISFSVILQSFYSYTASIASILSPKHPLDACILACNCIKKTIPRIEYKTTMMKNINLHHFPKGA